MRIIKKIIVAIMFMISMSAIAVFYFAQEKPSKSFIEPDLSKHPLYTKYKFDSSRKNIYLGTQPIYLPTGLITATMKQDGILQKKLNDLGFSLHFYPFLKGHDVNFFLKSGKIHIGIGGDMPTISIAATTQVFIPALIQFGPVSIVTKTPMLLKQMRGKRIGFAFGSNAHFMLLDFLAAGGIRKKDAELVSLEVSQMGDALANDDIDAFAAWEPMVSIALKEYNFIRNFQANSTGYIFFSQAFKENNPEAVNLILAAQVRAIRWIKKEREHLLQASRWALEDAKKLLKREVGFTALQNARAAQKDLLGSQSILSCRIPGPYLERNGPLHREFGFLKKIKRIPVKVKWIDVQKRFDTVMISEIEANPEKYMLDEFEYALPQKNENL